MIHNKEFLCPFFVLIVTRQRILVKEQSNDMSLYQIYSNLARVNRIYSYIAQRKSLEYMTDVPLPKWKCLIILTVHWEKLVLLV